ncbi:PKD domain-containing protein, partial [Agaribacter marinus]
GRTVAKVSMFAPVTGTYTVVVNDNSASNNNDTGTGDYQLHYVKAPSANEHGSLINGDFVTETITLGDIDSWTLDAEAGEYVLLTIADLTEGLLSPQIAIYRPDGSRISIDAGRTVAKVSMFAPVTGTYTVVVNDNSASNNNDTGTGDYQLHYVKAPSADEHGPLSGSGSLDESITLGDIDSYAFFGQTGNTVSFAAIDIDQTSLWLQLLVIDPLGNLIASDNDGNVASINSLSLPLEGNYTLIVIDNSSSNTNDTGIGPYRLDYNVPPISPPPQAPIAVISAPSAVFKNQQITLDGGQSFDPDAGPQALSYEWTLVSAPNGSALSSSDIDNSSDVVATLTPDIIGEYEFALTVFDGADAGQAQTSVMVENRTPVADAGDNTEAETNSLVTLDGSQSMDADGDMITYQWMVSSQPDGADLTLDDSTTVAPSFTPTIMGRYEISLVVNDGAEDSLPDLVIIDVTDANIAPIAEIELSGIMQVGEVITLNAGNSRDPDNGPIALSYAWSSIGAINAVLSSNNEIITTFTPTQAGTYRLQLTVFDGENSDSVQVDISINDVPANQAPIAAAGEDQTIELGNIANLSGIASNDPDDSPTPLSFEWRFVSVPAGSSLTTLDIVMPANVSTSFMPDIAGSYVIELGVTDGDLSDTDRTTVTVTEVIQPPQRCDVNADGSVDRLDIAAIFGRRNTPANGIDDPADWDGDGVITILDGRGCVQVCTLPRCNTTTLN